MRAIFGFLIAPLVAVISFLLPSFISELEHAPSLAVHANLYLLILCIALPIAYLFTLIFGVPAYLFLRSYGRLNFWTTLLTGFLVGLLLSLVLGSEWQAVLVGVGAGTMSSLVFWLIAVRGKKYTDHLAESRKNTDLYT